MILGTLVAFHPATALSQENAMLRQILYNNTNMPLYRNALDAYTARQRAIASNIANAETPRYEAKRVTFEQRLSQALGRPDEPLNATNEKHMPLKTDPRAVRPMVVEDEPANSSSGVNGVDVEREMANLATTQLQFDLTATGARWLFDRVRDLARLP
jgi:flagellar basal-body rod protein FlgB